MTRNRLAGARKVVATILTMLARRIREGRSISDASTRVGLLHAADLEHRISHGPGLFAAPPRLLE